MASISEEARKKISESARDNWSNLSPEEQKAQIDRCHTEEARAKSSKKAKARWDALPPEVKAERIAKMHGGIKPMTEEQRQARSEQTRRSWSARREKGKTLSGKIDKRSKAYKDAHPEVVEEARKKYVETCEKKRAAKTKRKEEKVAQEAKELSETTQPMKAETVVELTEKQEEVVASIMEETPETQKPQDPPQESEDLKQEISDLKKKISEHEKTIKDLQVRIKKLEDAPRPVHTIKPAPVPEIPKDLPKPEPSRTIPNHPETRKSSPIATFDTALRFSKNKRFKLDIHKEVASVSYWWREEWIPVKAFRDEDPEIRRNKATQLFELLSDDGSL